MIRLRLSSGDIVTLNNISLPLGRYIRIQPQHTSFLEITDPRAVLEHTLRSFSAMTVGDIVSIFYNEQIYDLLVLEVKPDDPQRGHAVSVVETDLQVEFEAPLGYVEGQASEASMDGQEKEFKVTPLRLPKGVIRFLPVPVGLTLEQSLALGVKEARFSGQANTLRGN